MHVLFRGGTVSGVVDTLASVDLGVAFMALSANIESMLMSTAIGKGEERAPWQHKKIAVLSHRRIIAPSRHTFSSGTLFIFIYLTCLYFWYFLLPLIWRVLESTVKFAAFERGGRVRALWQHNSFTVLHHHDQEDTRTKICILLQKDFFSSVFLMSRHKKLTKRRLSQGCQP